jgi:hypothetical protein
MMANLNKSCIGGVKQIIGNKLTPVAQLADDIEPDKGILYMPISGYRDPILNPILIPISGI